MDSSPFPPLPTLLPHRGQALLLERIVDWSPTGASCEATLTSRFPYAHGETVEALCGLELLAQTAAVFLALARRTPPTDTEERDTELAVASGYLVGVPEAAFHGTCLPLNVPLTARVTCLWQRETAARFRGDLRSGDQLLVSADLQVFEPPPAVRSSVHSSAHSSMQSAARSEVP